MKIILLENGEDPRVETILNDNPAGEMDELLGGPIAFADLANSLQLVTRRYGEELKLPIRYRWDDGHTVRPIYGNCAVVRTQTGGNLGDIYEPADLIVAAKYIRPV